MINRKQTVLTAMTNLIGKADLASVEPLLAPDFVDHNRQLPTMSREEWLAAFRVFPLQDMRIDLELLVAEGDLVTMFSRRWLPDGEVIAVADVFRFSGDLITEHWEVVQPLGQDDTNPLHGLGAHAGAGAPSS